MDVVRIKEHQQGDPIKKGAPLIVQDHGMVVVQIRKPQPEGQIERDVLFTVLDTDTVVVQTM